MLELVLCAGGEHEPAGRGGVAAEGTLLLGEDNLLAGESGLHAGGQASDAGTDDQDVGLLGERDVGRTDQIAGLVSHSSTGTNRSASNQASGATELDEISASNLHKNIPFRLTPYGCAPHVRHGAIPALPLCASASRCKTWRPAPWRKPHASVSVYTDTRARRYPQNRADGDGVAYALVDGMREWGWPGSQSHKMSQLKKDRGTVLHNCKTAPRPAEATPVRYGSRIYAINAAAFWPALIPMTTISHTALPPRRLSPWMPPVTSPAANRPGTFSPLIVSA